MLKMSTREQCQVCLSVEDGEHFEKVVCGIWKANVGCEDCRQALSKEIWLSKFGERCLFGFRTSNPVGDLALEIQRTSALKKWSVVSGKLMLHVKIADKLYPRKSGSRSSESGASSVFEQAILSGIWLSRFRERCLFDFWESNPVGCLTFEIRRAVSLRFLRK
ncbi:hypothetical protein ACFX2J_013456 [Malus domestica]